MSLAFLLQRSKLRVPRYFFHAPEPGRKRHDHGSRTAAASTTATAAADDASSANPACRVEQPSYDGQPANRKFFEI